jgi:hypothetical protein
MSLEESAVKSDVFTNNTSEDYVVYVWLLPLMGKDWLDAGERWATFGGGVDDVDRCWIGPAISGRIKPRTDCLVHIL